MNKRATAVVEAFRQLTDHEKIGVFLEIEEVWKAMQARPLAPRPDPLKA
jgi:hypothetical protein